MSGHNKWSTIKHKKGAADAKRGKIFTKLIRELTTAARQGGGDADGNPRLRAAIAAAKGANMPSDNVKRAIMKGTGELEGETYEENTYEGYGPGGVALIVETLTDNRNRTVAEVRHIMGKHGGNLGENGSVSWMFERKGQVVVEKEKDGKPVDEDELMMAALDAGAEDVKTEDDAFYVLSVPSEMESVREALEAAGFPIERAEQARIPTTTIRVEGKQADQILKLVDALEESDDVQKVWANFDIPDSFFESMND
jgi:YebC/PmpR family DNA-binding regulatory protein